MHGILVKPQSIMLGIMRYQIGGIWDTTRNCRTSDNFKKSCFPDRNNGGHVARRLLRPLLPHYLCDYIIEGLWRFSLHIASESILYLGHLYIAGGKILLVYREMFFFDYIGRMATSAWIPSTNASDQCVLACGLAYHTMPEGRRTKKSISLPNALLLILFQSHH